MDKQPHLLVCISAHGFGHVAQVAPVLNALGERMPDLRLTVRATAPLVHLQSRIRIPFNYVRDSGDIGMLMSSALDVRALLIEQKDRTKGFRIMPLKPAHQRR